GNFTASVAIAPGLTPIAIDATDRAGNVRQADRSIVSARYLPEGTANPVAAGLVLTDAMLSQMGGSLAGDASSIDVAGEILAQPTLSSDSQCTTWPVQASQDPTSVALVQDSGALAVHVQVPNLYVYFEGECQGLLSTIPIAGEMAGTIDLWTQ